MRGSDTVRRADTKLSILIVSVLTGIALSLTASPAGADTPVGGPLLAGHGVIVAPGVGVPKPPKITAAAYVVADLETGQILAAKDPHRRLRPASTQKMLTALALLPRLDKDDLYVAHPSDVAQDGSSVGLVAGHRYTIDQLFLGMLLPSGNDAAHALARAGGGVKITRQLMQAEARRLQALDTTVVNSSGLDEPGQFSSAYDLALFARAGMARDDFRHYVGMRRAEFPGEARNETYQIQNQNKLLGKFPGTIGVKTGYTTMARNTFAVAVTRNGRTILVTLMRSDGSIREAAMALINWGFAYGDRVTPVGLLVDPAPPAPTAVPTPVPAAVPGQRGSSAAPLGDLATPIAAGSASAFVIGGLTVYGVRRRRQRRRARAELAYRAAGFSAGSYVPPPGPIMVKLPLPLDGIDRSEPYPPDGPGPVETRRPGGPDEPTGQPAPLYPDHGQRLDVTTRPRRRYSARPPRPDQYR